MFRILMLVILISTPAFAEGSFFEYYDDQGVVHYTDDIDRIPEKYFDQAQEKTWDDLKVSVEKRWTPINNKEK